MSQENVEVVLEHIDAMNRGDVEALAATVSPDVEWEDTLFWTEPRRTFRGRAGVRQWLDQVWEPWADLQMEAREITDAGDGRLLLGFRLTARGKESGAETQIHLWTVSWITDGKVARRRSFRSRASALEAAGLQG